MEQSNLKISEGCTLVNNAGELANVVKAMRGTKRVAVDTEADSLHHYFEKVCLIQVSFSGANYIVDPLAGISLTEFFEVLAQKDLVLHAAGNDLYLLKKAYGFKPKAPIFDTMIAAQVLGYEKIGLAALVEKFYGVVLSKAGQKSDWSIRPLSPKLLEYASGDTKYLEGLADAMQQNLVELGRADWQKECCERAVRQLDAPEKVEVKDDWRVKGSSSLVPAELVFVRELWKWRDAEARAKDRPAFMIMKNEDLVEVAQWRAKNPLISLEEGPASLKRFKGDLRERLEKAVKLADNLTPEQWPARSERTPWYEGGIAREKVDPLVASCKTVADQLKIQGAFLASRAVLTALVEHQPQTVEKMMEVSGMMRWQAELVLPAMKKLQTK